jgi:hypothetical protein
MDDDAMAQRCDCPGKAFEFSERMATALNDRHPGALVASRYKRRRHLVPQPVACSIRECSLALRQATVRLEEGEPRV